MITIGERIKARVVELLERISKGNGFEYDIPGGIQRLDMRGLSLNTIPAIAVTFREAKTLGLASPPAYQCTLTATIDGYTHPGADPDDEGESSDFRADALLGDVQEALMADDLAPGSTGLQEFTSETLEILAITPFDAEVGQPFEGGTVTAQIRYRHSASSPRKKMGER